MTEALTYAVEAAVGAACLLGGSLAWRHRNVRWFAAAASIAGVAAIAHAMWSVAA